MEKKIRCLIIDDEPPARELLLYYLKHNNCIEVVGTCANGFETLKMIKDFNPDLLFLDIQMPKINGFELLELLDNPPEVIFCTAYDEFAIKAFEMHAIDYLLKPFTEERLQQAASRAVARILNPGSSSREKYEKLSGTMQKGNKVIERIVAKTGTTVTVIPLNAINYFEAQDDYVMVVSDFGNHLKNKTMKYYESLLPDDIFVRIHRSYIVNITKIKSISLYGKESYKVVLHSGAQIRASATGYGLLKELL